MTDAEANIRESLISTLQFLGSEEMQIEFAAKVPYRTYQDEFACWWFDTFFPEDQSTSHMFTENQLNELKTFSLAFNSSLSTLNDGDLSIQQLLAKPQWQSVILSAKKALSLVQNAT
jgi:hypothetical protein